MSKLLKEIADDFYHKGIAKGKAEFKAEVKAEVYRVKLDIARAMIEQGFNTATISGITGLSPVEIDKLRKQT